MRRWLPILLLIVVLPSVAAGQVIRPGACEAPDASAAAIGEARRLPVDPVQMLGRSRQLADQSPGDIWIQRAYIDAARRADGTTDEAVVAELKGRADAAPADPRAQYLYAYALLDQEPQQAIALLTSLTETSPDFPLAWLTAASLYVKYPNLDSQKRLPTLANGFLSRCPGSIEPTASILAIQVAVSDNTLVAFARALRTRIEGRADARTIPLYVFLWELEGRFLSPGALSLARQRHAADRAFLAGLNRTAFPAVAQVLGFPPGPGARRVLDAPAGGTTPGAPATRIPDGEFGAGAYRPGPGISNVVVIAQANPKYTSAAMKVKIQGVVSLDVVVLADGIVGDVRVTRSLDSQLGLDEAAVEAAKQWRFQPARDATGTAVPVVVTLQMDFRLK